MVATNTTSDEFYGYGFAFSLAAVCLNLVFNEICREQKALGEPIHACSEPNECET
jgi:hypothetical protein